MFKTHIVLVLLVCAPLSVFANQGVDPTKPLTGSTISTSVKKTGALVLESVVSREKSRVAIINGKLLKQGDTIGKYQIKRLEKNSVLLASFDGELELTIFSEEVAISK